MKLETATKGFIKISARNYVSEREGRDFFTTPRSRLWEESLIKTGSFNEMGMKPRIGHIYPLRKGRIGHIYPLRREHGGKGEAQA